MTASSETRDKIREIVRRALDAQNGQTQQPQEFKPEHVLVNSLRDDRAKDWDRDESAKNLLTEDDIRGLDEGAKIRVAENVKFTPLAKDLIEQKSIALVTKSSRVAGLKARTVGVGCDHGGFEFKEKLKEFLGGLGLQVRDFGTNSKDAVDYPDFAHAVAKAVGGKQCDVGIVIDGAGIGSAMTANKVPGVRAAACYSVALAKNSREHNGANVLSLGSGQNSFEEIKAIAEAWLTTELTEERHKKRVGKIDNIQKQYSV